MRLKFIFIVFVLLFTRLLANGQQKTDSVMHIFPNPVDNILTPQQEADSVMYISYIPSKDDTRDAYESMKKNIYFILLSIPKLSREGGRTLTFDGELKLLTIPKSAVDTSAIVDWTKSRTWKISYNRELLDRVLRTKRFYFINKERQTDPVNYIVIRAVYHRPKYY